MTNPAAWHPDPTGAHEYRWWDGERWTEHVADGGQASVDPLAGGPATHEGSGTGATASSGDTLDNTSDPGVTTDADAGRESPGQTAAAGGGDQRGWQQPDTPASPDTGEPVSREWGEPRDPGTTGGGWQPSGSPGGEQGYGQPATAWSQPEGTPSANPTNGIAIAAVVIGVLSLLFAFVPIIGLLGGLGGILALILGFVGRRKARELGTGHGAALAGVITGILALIISVVITIGLFAFGSGFVDSYSDCIDAGGTPESCEQELERDLLDRFGV